MISQYIFCDIFCDKIKKDIYFGTHLLLDHKFYMLFIFKLAIYYIVSMFYINTGENKNSIKYFKYSIRTNIIMRIFLNAPLRVKKM